ncbi:cytochrome c3 family protein [Taklimakanibacter lacteus]|uniref:cytochrome c3 family protein n=1 Tax=Taklimakanibacter lacteus TaxID=2268456 RepID=UPI0013C43D45
MRMISGADRLGGALLAAALLALAFQPTDATWWLVRTPGILALLLSACALMLQPDAKGRSWHRYIGSFAIVAVSLHVLAVAGFEPSFWRWLDGAVPVEIIAGIVAALALFATLAVRRALTSPKSLILHRIAGFMVVVAAALHVAFIAGTHAAILGFLLAGMLILVFAALLPERRKLILVALPTVLLGIIAALATGPMAQLRLASLRSSPIDHANFNHGDHTGFVCTACHHNFTDRTGKENCLTCHKALSDSESMRIDRLFHAFCSDCHRREALAGRKSGPIDHCTACHGT